MKTTTLQEFMSNLTDTLTDITRDGGIIRVESERSGAFVVMGDGEYSVMSESFRVVTAIAESVNAGKKTINIDALLKKLNED